MKKILIYLILQLLVGVAQGQFFGNIVEDRIVSSPRGVYIFPLDDEYLLTSGGQFRNIYQEHPALEVFRAEKGDSFKSIGLIHPIHSAADLNTLFGYDIAQELYDSEEYPDIKDEASLLKFFAEPNNNFKFLALDAIPFMRSLGMAFLDSTAELGKKYSYVVKWQDTQKEVFKKDVTVGERNRILDRIKLQFNELSLAALDSSVAGAWFHLKTPNLMTWYYNVYGKKSEEQDFKLLETKRAFYAGDTLNVGVLQKVKPLEVWNFYIKPVDIIGNEGIASDTATLIAVSKQNLASIDNIAAQDSVLGILLTWTKLKPHSYLSGILVSRSGEDKKMEVLDTLAVDSDHYFDYKVEHGKAYNYELQPLTAPVHNLVNTNFVRSRVAATHNTSSRILPPKGVEAKLVDGRVQISWKPLQDTSQVLNYYVMHSLNGTDFSPLAQVSPSDTMVIDTLNYGVFNYAMRHYAVQVFGINLKFSDISNIVSFQAPKEIKIERPVGLILRKWDDGIKLEWEQSSADLSFTKGFKVYRSVNQGDFVWYTKDSSLVTQREFFDAQMEVGNNYAYFVTAVSLSGLESDPTFSQDLTFEYFAIPQKPDVFTKVFYRSIPNKQIEVSWVVPINSTCKSVKIYRMLANNENNETWKELVVLPVGTVSYRDKDVQMDQSYFYAVSGIDQSGEESAKEFRSIITAEEVRLD